MVCVRVQGVLLYKKHAHPSTLVGVRKHTQAHPLELCRRTVTMTQFANGCLPRPSMQRGSMYTPFPNVNPIGDESAPARCGARNRRGRPCRLFPCPKNRRCLFHGGRSRSTSGFQTYAWGRFQSRRRAELLADWPGASIQVLPPLRHPAKDSGDAGGPL